MAITLVAGCTDDDPGFAPTPTVVSTATPPTVAEDGHDSSTAAPVATPADATGETVIDLPSPPRIVLPDLRELDDAGNQILERLEGVLTRSPTIELRTLVCDTTGERLTGAIDVFDENGRALLPNDAIVEIGSDGSGSYSSDAVQIVVESDGSGSYSSDSVQIVVESDGSGSYSSDGVQIVVESDGSGTYASADLEIDVDSRGRGFWRAGQARQSHRGDGRGTYEGPLGTVEIAGDGTGMLDGQPVLVDPLPDMPLAPAFEPLGTLAPLGQTCGTTLRLSDELLFDFDSDQLRPGGREILVEVAAAIAELGDVTVDIEGHTDDAGSDAYNNDLSERRAAAVALALGASGVTAPLTVSGLGESEPVGDNTTASGRQRNRRVELVIRPA